MSPIVLARPQGPCRVPPALCRLLETMSTTMLSLSSLFTQVAFHDVRGRFAFRLANLLPTTDRHG